MAVGPGWIVTDMLLMPAVKVCDPIEAFIQMIIHNFARNTCGLRRGTHCLATTTILRSLFLLVLN